MWNLRRWQTPRIMTNRPETALHGRRRCQRDLRAGFETGRRSGLCLPGHATVRLHQAASVWDARQYLEDYTSGNASLWQIVRGAIYVSYYYGSLAYNRRLAGRRVGSTIGSSRSGAAFLSRDTAEACRPGGPAGGHAHLQPGEFARIKSYEEILPTLGKDNKTAAWYLTGR